MKKNIKEHKKSPNLFILEDEKYKYICKGLSKFVFSLLLII